MKYDAHNLMMGLDLQNKSSSTMHVSHCPRNEISMELQIMGDVLKPFDVPLTFKSVSHFPIENNANGPLHKLLSVFKI